MHSPTLSGASGRLHMAEEEDIRSAMIVKVATTRAFSVGHISDVCHAVA